MAAGPLTVRINADHVFVLKPKPQQHNSFIYFCTIKEASRAHMPWLFAWRVKGGTESWATGPFTPRDGQSGHTHRVVSNAPPRVTGQPLQVPTMAPDHWTDSDKGRPNSVLTGQARSVSRTSGWGPRTLLSGFWELLVILILGLLSLDRQGSKPAQ